MINISIDLPEKILNNLTPQVSKAIEVSVSQTLMATKSHWESYAQQKLKTTRADYLLGLSSDGSVSFPDPFTGILTLKGKWANMLEDGFPSYDMKNGFKNGPRKKQKKDGGWYTTIPFRHRTPDTAGSAVGGQAMPQDIYAQARALRAGARLIGTEQQYPQRTSWTGYKHKNGIYEGMAKNKKAYDKAIQSTYFTFRRVSDKSDPQSWWHPGFSGLKATDVVGPFARNTFTQVLQSNLKMAMGG